MTFQQMINRKKKQYKNKHYVYAMLHKGYATTWESLICWYFGMLNYVLNLKRLIYFKIRSIYEYILSGAGVSDATCILSLFMCICIVQLSYNLHLIVLCLYAHICNMLTLLYSSQRTHWLYGLYVCNFIFSDACTCSLKVVWSIVIMELLRDDGWYS